MALHPLRVRAIRSLRAAGKIQREIASIVRVSRVTVYRILAGHGRHAATAADPVAPDPDPDWPGKPHRCRICGAMITGYCVACGVPPFPPAEAAGSLDDEEMDAILTVDLVEPERSRYEPIRDAKIRAAIPLDELSGPTLAELAEIECAK